jgi:hypothetical protein
MSNSEPTVLSLFANSAPLVQEIYQCITAALHEIGPFTEEPKKTSIHLVRKSGFGGIHPRKHFLILTLRLARALEEEPRLAKTEQVSRNRYHNEIKLEQPDEVDDRVKSWLREAYEL